jgi:hypothetical protein
VASVRGRPARIRAERRVHRRRSHSRCDRTTVSGCTRTSAARQFRHVWAKTIQKQAISRPKLRTAHRTFQGGELLAKREVLQDQFAMSAAGQRNAADQDKDHAQHASILSFWVRRINCCSTVLILANDCNALTALARPPAWRPGI